MNEKWLSAVRAVSLLLLTASCSTQTIELPRAGDACNQIPEPDRWMNAGVPDVGARPPLLSAHRGGVTLAPENTLAAYRHAFAYEMDFVEVDVRETADGVFVSMHDDSVDRTTNGTGAVSSLSWSYIQSLNAADFEPWKGSQYDPSPVPRVEQILELAQATGRGIEFDVKTIRNPTALFDLVASYGLLSHSFFSLDEQTVGIAQVYNPEIRAIFNMDGDEPPAALFAASKNSAIFGSRREKFTPEIIAAIHDGCSFVLPHSYDLTEILEVEEFRRGLADGADGAQVNQPDIMAAAAQRRIPAALVHLSQENKVCLRNANNSLGLPRRLLTARIPRLNLNLFDLTDRDGCIDLPLPFGEFVIRHDDSAAVRGAKIRVRANARRVDSQK